MSSLSAKELRLVTEYAEGRHLTCVPPHLGGLPSHRFFQVVSDDADVGTHGYASPTWR